MSFILNSFISFPSGGAPTITVGNTTNSGWLQDQNTSITHSHTCTANTKMLVVSVTSTDQTDPGVTGITYNSVSMTSAISDYDSTSKGGIYLFHLENPTTGSAQDVVFSFTSTDYEEVTLTAVDLEVASGSISLDVVGTVNILTTGDPTADITTVAAHTIMLDVTFSLENVAMTEGANQTLLYSIDMGISVGAMSYRIESSADTYTFDWDAGGSIQDSKTGVVSFKSTA